MQHGTVYIFRLVTDCNQRIKIMVQFGIYIQRHFAGYADYRDIFFLCPPGNSKGPLPSRFDGQCFPLPLPVNQSYPTMHQNR
jgi:hypothetical protein